MAPSHPRRAVASRRRTRVLTARAVGLCLLVVAGSAVRAAPAGAATAVDLKTAAPFALLSGAGITNVGQTTVGGDIGSAPTPSMTGFGPGADSVTLTGEIHANDGVAILAKNDLTTAFDQASAATPPIELAATELGGRTLTPGVYHHDTLGLTGTLTLDTLGDPDAVFIFQSDTTLVTAVGSAVTVLDGATTCNVFWRVGTSATLAAASSFLGTVLADQSISVGNATTIIGRLQASVGSITLDTDTITVPLCAASLTPPPTTPAAVTPPTTPAAVTPPPATVAPVTPASTVSPPATAQGSVDPAPVVTPAPPAVAPPAAPTPPAAATPSAPVPPRTTTPAPRTTAGGSVTTSARPPLAATGLDGDLPTVAALLLGTGSLLLAATHRRRPAGAHYRKDARCRS